MRACSSLHLLDCTFVRLCSAVPRQGRTAAVISVQKLFKLQMQLQV